MDVNKTIRNTARFEQWVDEVKNAIKTVEVHIPDYKGVSDENCKKEYLLTVADIHTGKKGESLDNYYSLDVLQDRMWQIRDEVVQEIQEKRIKTLRILILGDLIDGLLRASQIKIQSCNHQTVSCTILFEWLTLSDVNAWLQNDYCFKSFSIGTSCY